MSDPPELVVVSLIGFGTTSSVLLGAAIGLYVPLSKRMLAGLLACAAGALISALAIDLALGSAKELHLRGFDFRGAWFFVGGGFALGASLYFVASRFLERSGAAVRYPSRFREYVRDRERHELLELIRFLAKSGLLRNLPPEEVEALLRCVCRRRLVADETLFRSGDPGDALYVVVRGKVEVLTETEAEPSRTTHAIAELGEAQAFGEMALLSGGTRTATVRALTDTELLAIPKQDFDRLIAGDPQLAEAVERISHDRAIRNLSDGAPNPATWAKVAVANLDHLRQYESKKLLTEIGKGAGSPSYSATSSTPFPVGWLSAPHSTPGARCRWLSSWACSSAAFRRRRRAPLCCARPAIARRPYSPCGPSSPSPALSRRPRGVSTSAARHRWSRHSRKRWPVARCSRSSCTR